MKKTIKKQKVEDKKIKRLALNVVKTNIRAGARADLLRYRAAF